MIRKMTVLAVALILSFVFCSVSEAVNLKKAIIGKWVEVKKDGRYGDQIEFLKEGTVIVGSVVGDYKFIDDNRLRLDVKGIFGSGAMVFEVSIDNQGQLILTDSAGSVGKHITKAEWEKREVERKKREALARAEEEKRRAEQAKREAAERAEWVKWVKERFIISDLTVLHKETKLMWTRDANIARHDRMTWKDAVKFIESLNQQKYAGYNDWRLPSREELETLANFANKQGYTENMKEYFNKIGFKNVQAHYYWSSTTDDSSAWFVSIDRVDGELADKTSSAVYVLPVRAVQ